MKSKKVPMRKCVGCMESKPKRELIRLVHSDETGLLVDITGKANGRGVYLCPHMECAEKAKKRRAVQRNLEIEISEENFAQVFEELIRYEKKN